ncbi:Autophagy-related protein 29 [Cladobotryum mycophilum]|uniref:Autophagy-related protein 29 n=1 Tax=Cladobotryum mycophilum TaxID=491253 RepID=A0ABR0SGG5_9HYPO
MAEPTCTYTIFVRVPIPRGTFVDPPTISWDLAKDEALWKILSGAAQKEIDWNLVADRFEVPVDFLVQQVAYLTERHASQVRAQVRKATAAAKGSAAPSPIPGSESAGVGNLRTASALSIRRDSPMPRNEGSAMGAAVTASSRPTISRNTSANTAVLRETGASSPKIGSRPGTRPTDPSRRKRLSSLPIASPAAKSPEIPPEGDPDGLTSPDPADLSSVSSDDDDDSVPAESRIIRRPPRFQQPDTGYRDDEDEESEPAFQPYKAPRSSDTSSHDLASTLRGIVVVGKGGMQGILERIQFITPKHLIHQPAPPHWYRGRASHESNEAQVLYLHVARLSCLVTGAHGIMAVTVPPAWGAVLVTLTV